jgi:hypothetical protein
MRQSDNLALAAKWLFIKPVNSIGLAIMSNNPPDQVFSADSPRLLDRDRARLRLGHRGEGSETAYVGWIKRFLVFHGKRHPATRHETSRQWRRVASADS